MHVADGVITGIVAAGGSIAGMALKAKYDVWIARKANETTIATAAMEARSADDLRINERVRMLLDSYEERIAQMETQMNAIRAELQEVTARLNAAQEERRMAEITIETAHMRVEDLETELTATRENLKTARALLEQATVREASLATQNETLRKRIVALESRVAELEDLLSQNRESPL